MTCIKALEIEFVVRSQSTPLFACHTLCFDDPLEFSFVCYGNIWHLDLQLTACTPRKTRPCDISLYFEALTAKSSGKVAGNVFVSICPMPTAIFFAKVSHGADCSSYAYAASKCNLAHSLERQMVAFHSEEDR